MLFSGTKIGQSVIHSGWSYPPSREYLSNYASGFIPYYRDFQKQWHYNFTVVECRDPYLNVDNETLEYLDLSSSDSYYPPGRFDTNYLKHY